MVEPELPKVCPATVTMRTCLYSLGLVDQLDDAGDALFTVGRAEIAFRRKPFYQRVDAECDADILLGDALLFRLSPGRARRHWPFLSAEGDLDSRNTDVLEQHVEVCRRKNLADAMQKPSESTPALRIFSASAFASLGAYDAHGLVYAPAVVRVRTAYVKGTRLPASPGT